MSRSSTPAVLHAAIIDPANWIWHDDTTGLPTSPLVEATAEHDLREARLVPPSNPDLNDWVIVSPRTSERPTAVSL